MRARLFLPFVVVTLSGCTAIDLDAIKPKNQSGANCARDSKGSATAALTNQMPVTLAFVLPNSLAENRGALLDPAQAQRGELATPRVPTVSFARYAAIISTANDRLPPSLQNDEVVAAMMRVMTKSVGEAHLAAANAAGLRVAQSDVDSVSSYSVPSTLSHRQLELFAGKIMASGLRPVAKSASLDGANDGTANPALSVYFTDYYEGKYLDRFGTKIDKPKIALTIPDAEITAALAVLLDYIVDLVDPTPVLGDTPTAGDKTKFYPGGGAEPTALRASLASYAQLPPDGCGVTLQNIDQLSDFAHGAADSAGAVSGLVSQSFGGFEIGLGFVGKFSFGDNQLLANLVKTAASRIALRSTFAGLFAAFHNPKQDSQQNPSAAQLIAPAPVTTDVLLFQ